MSFLTETLEFERTDEDIVQHLFDGDKIMTGRAGIKEIILNTIASFKGESKNPNDIAKIRLHSPSGYDFVYVRFYNKNGDDIYEHVCKTYR